MQSRLASPSEASRQISHWVDVPSVSVPTRTRSPISAGLPRDILSMGVPVLARMGWASIRPE